MRDMKTDRTRINRRDWILAAALLIVAGVLFLAFRLQMQGGGTQAEVRVDGKLAGTYSLMDDGTYPIRTKYGVNMLEIRDGKACISEADCPGHDCIRQGSVWRKGETIVCLPHRMVIEITASSADKAVEGSDSFDTVAK